MSGVESGTRTGKAHRDEANAGIRAGKAHRSGIQFGAREAGRIRFAQAGDARELAELSQEALVYAWSSRDFLDSFKNPQAKVILYEEDHVLLGYAVLYHAADEGEVASVGVRRSARRRGIGRLLLQELLVQGSENGVSRFFLEVRESNVPAQSLYEAMGFLRVGVRKDFYEHPREDAFLMMRDGRGS